MTELEPYNPDLVARRVFLLRQIGMDWADIQKDFQEQDYGVEMVPTVNALRQMLRNYTLQMASYVGPDDREMMMGLELTRLDTLQASVWPQAVGGDTKAVETVLKIMGQRQKILGMDQLSTMDKTTLNTVLVVGEDKQAFIDALVHGQLSGNQVAGDDLEDEEETLEDDQ